MGRPGASAWNGIMAAMSDAVSDEQRTSEVNQNGVKVNGFGSWPSACTLVPCIPM
jgi:hypothetical protein